MAETGGGNGLRRATPAAFLLVIMLAVAALLWPRGDERAGLAALVVFDPTGDPARVAAVYDHLAVVLAEVADRPVAARVVATTAEVHRLAADGDIFFFGPDALALQLAAGEFKPVVAARRPPPRNLRPRGVLVRRRAAPETAAPWRTHPGRTVLGDSVSLVVTGAWRMDADALPPVGAIAAGPDPWDHAPALHALRLGGYDYALVRQWDADRFFAQGLLTAAVWSVQETTPPVPDLVLLAPRSLATGRRLALGEALTRVGREDDGPATAATSLGRGLAQLHLTGFNLLVEPDFERVRRLAGPDPAAPGREP